MSDVIATAPLLSGNVQVRLPVSVAAIEPIAPVMASAMFELPCWRVAIHLTSRPTIPADHVVALATGE